MSLARQFLREFRPLFRMLEEPIGRSPAYTAYPRTRSLLDDPFFHSPAALRPAVDVMEEGNNYIVEAEVPGVKKENINVRIGDGGQSVTIEGKIVDRRSTPAQTSPSEASQQTGSSSESGTSGAEIVHNAEGKYIFAYLYAPKC
jgi:HSP20 family molecular chaperone IbpA